MLKIALVAPFEEPVPPKKYGGTELVVYNLAEELVKLGHDVTLFASGDSKTSAKLVACTPKSIRSVRASHNARVNAALTYSGLMKALDVMRDEKFDIVSNHMGWPFFPLVQYLKSPVVTTLHNSLRKQYPRFYEEIYMYNQYKNMPLISISNSQSRSLKEYNFISTIYDGIQVEKFPFNAKADDYLLFFGRMSPEKGPEEAIKMAKKTGHKLIMAGKINSFERSYFRQKIKPQIDGKQIQFLGEVGRESKIKVRLYQHAKALLAPLRWDEPFGLVSVEAMACGTPVITMNRGSSPEIMVDGKTGYLCHSFKEMTARISDLDKIKRADCRKHIEQNFTAKIMAKRYVDVFEQYIGK